MFVLVFAVPALLVVVAGYVVGYGLVDAAYGLAGADPSRAPELAGWGTGLVLLAVVVRLLVARRRRARSGDARDHQK
ncbi:MAG: hypothetical protein ACLGI3_20310 [Actinomycetes bacterium]